MWVKELNRKRYLLCANGDREDALSDVSDFDVSSVPFLIVVVAVVVLRVTAVVVVVAVPVLRTDAH